MMGNPIRTQKIRLDKFPVYLESSLPAAELKQFIVSAKQTGIQNPVKHSVELRDRQTFAIRLENVTSQTLTGFAECASRKQPFKLYGEKTLALPFRAPAPISLEPQELTMKLHVDGFRDAEHKIRVSGITIPSSPHELRIDGDLSDWPASARQVVLDARNARSLVPWSDADNSLRDFAISFD